jgi:cyanophycinase
MFKAIFILLCGLAAVGFPGTAGWRAQKNPAGSLVIIGGALKPGNEKIYNAFIQLGGGAEKIRIAVIPAASITPVKSGNSYIEDFIRYGVPETHIKLFPVAMKDDPSTGEVNESQWSRNGFDGKLAEEMRRYNAVFLVGGDQARYRDTLKDSKGNDSPLLTAIREIYRKGGVIGGTSAGAAVMSDPMICGGDSTAALLDGAGYRPDACPGHGGVHLTAGLGFLPGVLVDQHFIKRGRFGRLLAALLKNRSFRFGIGIDEDTAAVYHGGTQTVEVAGSAGIIVVDAPNTASRQTGGIRFHYLEDGDRCNIASGEFSINNLRKKIEKGKEYYETSPMRTDIFAKDAVKDIVTTGLADNRQPSAVGLAFALDPPDSGKKGKGVRLVFRKKTDTAGYWGKIQGRETYSVLNVYLDIIPIEITINSQTGGKSQ